MGQLEVWCKAHWLFLAMLPGNLLALEAVIMNAAQAHGYTKTASMLKKIGNFLSFLSDIIGQLLIKQTPKTGA